MSATQIKLTYFPVMAVAEPIRWLLTYGGLQFQDIRLSATEWEQQKNSSPLATVPIFEVDGRVMHQSVAICRYVGALVGLAGENIWENFEIDVAVDSVSDLRAKISGYNKLPAGSSQRPPLKQTLIQETVPFYLARLEEMAAHGYMANGKVSLSWADIFFTALLDYMNGVLKVDILAVDKYHNLTKIRDEVRTIPSIQSWIDRRPASEY